MTEGLGPAWYELPRAWGAAPVRGRLRSTPEDFRVEEELGFEPTGDGEHLLLLIRKTGMNTADVSRWLAEVLSVRRRDVGHAGLKDRHAVTDQWFGVHLPGRDPRLPDPPPGIQVLRRLRHRRKLRPGALRGNRFVIRLRELRGAPEALPARLLTLARFGVPNWFGLQRFGRGGGNLVGAERLFAGHAVRDRQIRGLYLSAARSLLFNQALAERGRDGSWQGVVPGDVMTFSGSRSLFPADASTPDDPRLRQLDLHATGPLHGLDGIRPSGRAAELERAVLGRFPALCAGLEAFRMRADRRALRLPVRGLGWWQPDRESLELQFFLPPGSFATAVIRELAELDDGPAGGPVPA